MEMGAVSLTLPMSCIRLQLNMSLTWPTLSRVGRCQIDQVRLQGCLWWGPAPLPHMSLSYVAVRQFFNFFVDARALSVSVAGSLWIVLGLFVSELLFGGR